MIYCTGIREGLDLLDERNESQTRISIVDNNYKYVLIDMKTNENYKIDWTRDNNYIVIYSYNSENIKTIEVVFDINHRLVLPLNIDQLKLIDNMLLSSKSFSLEEVLTLINNYDLGLISKEKKEELIDFITSNDDSITNEEIVDYITDLYPILNEFTDFNNKISKEELNAISKELETPTFQLNSMPHVIDFRKANKLVKTKKY